MSASPVVAANPVGGLDLFAIAPNHNLLHASVPSIPALAATPGSAPTWENLGGIVYEVDASWGTLTLNGSPVTLLTVLAHGGPAGPGGLDKLYVRTMRPGQPWGDWIRLDAVDVA